MIFLVASIVLYVITVALLIWAFILFNDKYNNFLAPVIPTVLAVISFVGGFWLQTHRIVPVNNVGVARATFSQELSGPFPAGVVTKPFFGSISEFPASTDMERCENFTPAIKGAYGITMDVCFYYNAGNVNWLAEIERTGLVNANGIMAVWRNSIVGDVARTTKDYTPEALSEDRSTVERAIFESVNTWFTERGIELTRLSLKNWDFTDPTVAAAFNEGIVSQRRIAEEAALMSAAELRRNRETYEAETSRMVAETQKQSLDQLGLEGEAAVQYLWIKALLELNKAPDVLILGGGNSNVSVPFSPQQPATPVTAQGGQSSP